MSRGDKRKNLRKFKRPDIATFKSRDSQVGSKETLAAPKLKKGDLPNLKKLGEKLEKRVKQENRVVKKQTTDQQAMLELAKKAVVKGIAFQPNVNLDSFQGTYHGDAAATGKKDNSRKAYFKEFKKVVQQADVILEILDARDPLGCRTKEVEEMIMNAGADKKIVLVLNKIDLVPRDNVEAWLKHLRNEFPTVAFKASTQTQRNNLGQSNVSAFLATDALLSGSESVGADALVKLLKNYCRNVNLKTSITVGVVGFPNVGKSSVINSLKRSKVCGVGSTPGVTKVAQTIQLDKNIKLLDCPGIVFSKSTNEKDSAQVLLRNCVKVELLEDPITPVELILSRCSHEQLRKIYGLEGFNNSNEFLVFYAKQRGKLLKGGVPDIDNAARAIIQDWNQGRIPFYTLPPKLGIDKGHHVSSAIVSQWSKEFSLNDLDDKEIISATSKDTDMIAIDSIGMANIDMQIVEEENEIDMDEYVTTLSRERNDPLIPEIMFNVPESKVPEIIKEDTLFTTEELELNGMPRASQLKKMLKKKKKDQRRMIRDQQDQMDLE